MFSSPNAAIPFNYTDDDSSGADTFVVWAPARAEIRRFDIQCENAVTGTAKIYKHPDAPEMEDGPEKDSYLVATLTITAGVHNAAINLPYHLQGFAASDIRQNLFVVLELSGVTEGFFNPVYDVSHLAN